MCGEKAAAGPEYAQALGSPPRVRGKVKHRAIQRRNFGITPACAGKSADCRPHSQADEDHPRVCGEKVLEERMKVNNWGSPPRVRGKAVLLAHDGEQLGITPACAGKRLKKALKNKDF